VLQGGELVGGGTAAELGDRERAADALWSRPGVH